MNDFIQLVLSLLQEGIGLAVVAIGVGMVALLDNIEVGLSSNNVCKIKCMRIW